MIMPWQKFECTINITNVSPGKLKEEVNKLKRERNDIDSEKRKARAKRFHTE